MSAHRDTFHLFAIEPWMKSGRCTAKIENPDDWFPSHSSGTVQQSTKHAIELCGACPVSNACLTYAIEARVPRPLSGIWGGTTESGRRRAVAIYRRSVGRPPPNY